MPHANFILSTCGTSLLTNQAPAEIQRINRHSNAKSIDDISAGDKEWLLSLVSQAKQKLQEADLKTVAKMSAELNGLIRFYGGTITRNHDHHLMLCTDTWMGETVAELEGEWLRQYSDIVEVKRQRDLQTAMVDSFQLALSDLVKWSEETLLAYREREYRIVFNLTAGFKPVQGFLQTLAMFYADEVVYIFQEADTLMRIPRLPIELMALDAVRDHLNVFRRLDLGLKIANTAGVPETMLMSIGGQVTLSPWGSLVWEQTRKRIYREKLWPSPSDKISWGEKFESSLKGLLPERLWMINEKVDDLARYLEKGQSLRSLDFKELKSPSLGSTHEIDAWSDQDAKRIYGHYDTGTFVLDKLDKPLH